MAQLPCMQAVETSPFPFCNTEDKQLEVSCWIHDDGLFQMVLNTCSLCPQMQRGSWAIESELFLVPSFATEAINSCIERLRVDEGVAFFLWVSELPWETLV